MRRDNTPLQVFSAGKPRADRLELASSDPGISAVTPVDAQRAPARRRDHTLPLSAQAPVVAAPAPVLRLPTRRRPERAAPPRGGTPAPVVMLQPPQPVQRPAANAIAASEALPAPVPVTLPGSTASAAAVIAGDPPPRPLGAPPPVVQPVTAAAPAAFDAPASPLAHPAPEGGLQAMLRRLWSTLLRLLRLAR